MTQDADSIIEEVKKLRGKEVLVVRCNQQTTDLLLHTVREYAMGILNDVGMPFRAVLFIPYQFEMGEFSRAELMEFRDSISEMIRVLETT